MVVRERQSLRLDRSEHLRAKHLGQRSLGKQIDPPGFSLAFRSPALLPLIDHRGGHQQMDMRVVVQLPRVRMQHRDGPRIALQRLVVFGKRTDGFPTRAQQQVKDDAGVRSRQIPKLCRKRKRQQKVLGRQPLLDLTFEPFLAFVMLAMRAKAMPIGMRDDHLMVAFGALHFVRCIALRTSRSLAYDIARSPLAREEVPRRFDWRTAPRSPPQRRRRPKPAESFDVPPGDGEAVHQAIDPFDGVVLGLVCQMGVTGRSENRMVTEKLLYLDQIDAGFHEMGGVAMPQAMRRNVFFNPQASTTLCRAFCTPPGSSGEVASAAPFKPPARLGKRSTG